jgi:hypothetical protein
MKDWTKVGKAVNVDGTITFGPIMDVSVFEGTNEAGDDYTIVNIIQHDERSGAFIDFSVPERWVKFLEVGKRAAFKVFDKISKKSGETYRQGTLLDIELKSK